MSPSMVSKTGCPTPAGRPRARHSTSPPTLSLSLFASSMTLTISAEAEASGHLTMLASVLALISSTVG